MNKNLWKSVIPILLWIILLLLPLPKGIQANAWHYFALFFAVIVGLILEPIAGSAIGLIGITAAIVLGYVYKSPAESIKWGLSGFSDSTVWLIFGAYMLSMGYEKSGLGKRIALLLVKILGKRTLGLGYAIALADLVIAPATPSNTARSAGTIYPIIQNIPRLYGSEPGMTSKKIGSYIMWTAFAVTNVTSSMFLTGVAPNLLAITIVKQTTGLEITWMQWLTGFLPVGAFLFLLLPLLVYIIYPPEIKISHEVPGWASGELKKMGNVAVKEVLMAILIILALCLWIFGRNIVHATTVVLITISLMIIIKVVSWDDILNNKTVWSVLVWFATLVTLADGLRIVKFIDWITINVTGLFDGFSPYVILAGLTAFFFLIHYVFASLTAHTTALLPIILAVGIAIPDMPLVPFCLMICYSIGLMGVITPYATGPAPVYYNSGYISRADFWRLGLIFGLIFLFSLLIIGIPYLSIIY